MPHLSPKQAPGWAWPGLHGDDAHISAKGRSRASYCYRGENYALGAFRCGSRDPLWDQVNWIGAGHHIVFPTTSVGICVMSEEPFLTGPNHVVLYNPGDQYKRHLVSSEGERSIFMVVRPDLLRTLSTHSDAVDEAGLRFASRLVPLGARAHLARWALVRYLSGEPAPDQRLVEQTCGFILRAVLDRAVIAQGGRNHQAIVNSAKILMTERLSEPLTLKVMAKELFVSPFHLARLFRAETSYTLHGYMTQLRLRRALDLLVDPELDVHEIGTRVGFSTHSHFTESFRRAFQVTPSFARKMDGEALDRLVAA
jgi:AraC-like DNA-binding protein